MILKNCRLVLDLCEGVENELADIRIEGDTIAEIFPAGGNYEGEEYIDCSGKTVLPGLFNLHVHLWANQIDSNVLLLQTEYGFIEDSASYMNTLLAYGYTSLRDVGGPYNIGINLRNSINAGKRIGPNIKTSGLVLSPNITRGFPFPCFSSLYGRPINNLDQIRSETRYELAENQADFIKVIGSAMVTNDKGEFESVFFPEELAELQKMAKLHGKYLAVHALSPEAFDAALECGAHTIEHAFEMTEENLQKLIATEGKTKIVGTLSCCAFYGDEFIYKENKGLILVREAGIMIGFGTDTGKELFLEAPEKEFTLRSSVLGYSNIDILKQATIYSADINMTSDTRGSIKVGKKADFAIIDGKPDEDLTLFAQPCAYVLKDGQVVAKNGYIKC